MNKTAILFGQELIQKVYRWRTPIIDYLCKKIFDMLSRRFYRAKTLQSVYSFQSGNNDNLGESRKQLLQTIENVIDIQVYYISFLLEVRDFFELRIEENKKKLLPSPEDLNPNTRFIDNEYIHLLRHHPELNSRFALLKINWSSQIDLLWKLYKDIKDWGDYQFFMSLDSLDFNEARAFYAKLFKKHIAFNPVLGEFLEERNIHWGSDSVTAALMTTAWMRNIDPQKKSTLEIPRAFKDDSQAGIDSDKDFVIKLFDQTILKSDTLEADIVAKIKNWESDRVTLIDKIIIKMALVEAMTFPSIPIKATMNEYLELAKQFSTPKSGGFINGVLDNAFKEFVQNGKIRKAGRGLKED